MKHYTINHLEEQGKTAMLQLAKEFNNSQEGDRIRNQSNPPFEYHLALAKGDSHACLIRAKELGLTVQEIHPNV